MPIYLALFSSSNIIARTHTPTARSCARDMCVRDLIVHLDKTEKKTEKQKLNQVLRRTLTHRNSAHYLCHGYCLCGLTIISVNKMSLSTVNHSSFC